MATAYRWSEEYSRHGFTGQTQRPKAVAPRLQCVGKTRRSSIAGKKPAIVELYTLKRIDNSRLVRHIEPVKLRNLYKTAALGGLIALCFLVYGYQHFRCIDLSFQLEDLKSKQAQAQSLNSGLKLEIATLRDPRRIDVIAQQQLGLKKPLPVQVREYASVDGAQVAAVHFVRPNHAP
jgi:cell division protein FtsL